MRKIRSVLFVFIIVFGLSLAVVQPLDNFPQVQAATQPVTLTTTVLAYLTLDITAGGTVAFGNLTPGTPICYATGTVASVVTNAANGYTLGLSDATAAPNSSMAQGGVYIPKMTNGTIATPVVWGSNYGVGANLYAADTGKDTTQWGAGTTVCDALNKYAAVPQAATTAHTVTGFHSSANTSSWSFKIDVPNTQQTGAYSGTVTYTATAVLS